ncbi:hypothetical protein Busp01_01200 [Trinickia caryophylli]|nr:hypothetical protein Busp01_01200 [Trinickia caryophylli]
MRVEVDLDFGQDGVSQPLGPDEHDRFERMSQGAQFGAASGGKFQGGHRKIDNSTRMWAAARKQRCDARNDNGKTRIIRQKCGATQ